jgi:hypothetical protein
MLLSVKTPKTHAALPFLTKKILLVNKIVTILNIYIYIYICICMYIRT